LEKLIILLLFDEDVRKYRQDFTAWLNFMCSLYTYNESATITGSRRTGKLQISLQPGF
jgi:hypothetical protein